MTQLLPFDVGPKPGNAIDKPATNKVPGVQDASLGQDGDVPVGKSFSETLDQEKLSREADGGSPQNDTSAIDAKLQPEEDVTQSDLALAPTAAQEDGADTPKVSAQNELVSRKQLPNVQSETTLVSSKVQPESASQTAQFQGQNSAEPKEAQEVRPKTQVTVKETSQASAARSPQGAIGAIVKASLAPAADDLSSNVAKTPISQDQKSVSVSDDKLLMPSSDPTKRPEVQLQVPISTVGKTALPAKDQQGKQPSPIANSDITPQQATPIPRSQRGMETPIEVATTEQVLRQRSANGHSLAAPQPNASQKTTDSILMAPTNNLESVTVLTSSGETSDAALGGLDASRAVRSETSQPFFARAAVMAPHQQAASIGAQIADVARQGQPGQIELRLNPEELGRLKMTFAGNETSMIVTIAAERPETSELMRRHIEQLAREMAENGFENVQFQFAEEQSTDGQTAHENMHQGSQSSKDPAPSTDTSPTSSMTTAHGPSPIAGSGLDLRI